MKIELPAKVREIISRLQEAGYEAYAVGGCVRDSLLNKEPKDWDITTSANPYEVKELFLRTIDTGIVHGTVTVMLGREGFEVTTYRVDGEYEDNRHPKQVEFTKHLIDDLKRRDFTINAMAYNEQEGIIDEFGGLKDLHNKIIRCVGVPSERFEEDALRILRAVRFSAQLDFEIDHDTLLAVKEKAENLKNISAERIREELNKLLLSEHPKKLMIAYEAGLTGVVLPEFDKMLKTEQNSKHHSYDVGTHCLVSLDYFAKKYPVSEDAFTVKQQQILRWTLLLHDVAKTEAVRAEKDGREHFLEHEKKGAEMAKTILKRLKFDNETVDFVTHLIKFHNYRYELTPVGMRMAMNQIGTEKLPFLFRVQRADLMAQNEKYREPKLMQLKQAEALYDEMKRALCCVELKDLAINGRDLIEAGITPGKKIGEVLNRLLLEVIKKPEKNTKEELLLLVKKEEL